MSPLNLRRGGEHPADGLADGATQFAHVDEFERLRVESTDVVDQPIERVGVEFDRHRHDAGQPLPMRRHVIATTTDASAEEIAPIRSGYPALSVTGRSWPAAVNR